MEHLLITLGIYTGTGDISDKQTQRFQEDLVDSAGEAADFGLIRQYLDSPDIRRRPRFQLVAGLRDLIDSS